jgi:predicted transcriptional regulator
MDEVEELAGRVKVAVLGHAGVTDPELRRRVYELAEGAAHSRTAESLELAPEVVRFVQAIAEDSNRASVESLVEKGRSDDEIFEIAVVASTAAGLVRLELGLRAARES